jgi:hypothetical protein
MAKVLSLEVDIFLAFTIAGGDGNHIGIHRRQAYIMRQLNQALNNRK